MSSLLEYFDYNYKTVRCLVYSNNKKKSGEAPPLLKWNCQTTFSQNFYKILILLISLGPVHSTVPVCLECGHILTSFDEVSHRPRAKKKLSKATLL